MLPNLLPLHEIKVVGLAGAGSVGTAWTALLLAKNLDVVVYDRDSQAAERLASGVKSAWIALRELGLANSERAPMHRVRFVASLEELASASDLVQENVAEALAVKQEVLAAIDGGLPPDRLILSSSGGVPPSRLQSFCAHPERVLLGHPFQPAYLVPLVEVVAGERTRPDAVSLAVDFYRSLGKHPITLRKEMVGHLSNRLQFALLREAIHCLSEGVASADDIDAAVRWGLGPRWAVMGPLMTFNLAGGDGGVEQLLARFHNDVQTWWDALGSPRLTPELCEALTDGVVELRKGRSNADWSRWRDGELINFLRYRSARPYLGDTTPAGTASAN